MRTVSAQHARAPCMRAPTPVCFAHAPTCFHTSDVQAASRGVQRRTRHGVWPCASGVASTAASRNATHCCAGAASPPPDADEAAVATRRLGAGCLSHGAVPCWPLVEPRGATRHRDDEPAGCAATRAGRRRPCMWR
eukprot:174497-Chlamydomonas_euryale.AAC.2